MQLLKLSHCPLKLKPELVLDNICSRLEILVNLKTKHRAEFYKGLIAVSVNSPP